MRWRIYIGFSAVRFGVPFKTPSRYLTMGGSYSVSSVKRMNGSTETGTN